MSRRERVAWIVGAIGLAASFAGWLMVPSEFPHAWLAAVTCFMAWPLGSLALLLIHSLTGGRWGWAIRPELAAAVSTLPLVLPAAVPVIFVTHALYPWMHQDVARHLHNRFYLNAPFFYARWALYLLVWNGLALKVLKAVRGERGDRALHSLAPTGLILLTLTVTFAAIDATLSIEPQFKSSVYGMLACAEALLFALSTALLVWTGAGTEQPRRDLGRLLLALLVLWAYLDFMQLLIVWNSDLPDEAGWYMHRLHGFWGGVAAAIAVVHFALPFFALLWPQVQRSRRALRSVACLLVLTEIVRAWWIVIPASGRALAWVDVAAMAAVLGIAAGIALHGRRGPVGVPAYG